LEEALYAVVLQAWDFRPGASFINEMDKASREARCTIAVLSPDYFTSTYTTVEWEAAYVKNPMGEEGFSIPVKVQECEVEGLLRTIFSINLVGLHERAAREKLLAGVRRKEEGQPRRNKPEMRPSFPGVVKHPIAEPQTFPGMLPLFWNVPYLRNALFTGREELLEQLNVRLTTGKASVLPQAIKGLGGIGKIQAAIEYAYRYHHRYRSVLWVNAASRDADREFCVCGRSAGAS
jgi:hypothetical protein